MLLEIKLIICIIIQTNKIIYQKHLITLEDSREY